METPKKPASAYQYEHVNFVIWKDCEVDYGFLFREDEDEIKITHYTSSEHVTIPRPVFVALMAQLINNAHLYNKARNAYDS